jgi:NADH dehydrogenase
MNKSISHDTCRSPPRICFVRESIGQSPVAIEGSENLPRTPRRHRWPNPTESLTSSEPGFDLSANPHLRGVDQGAMGEPVRPSSSAAKHRVVVIGGGFGGLRTVTSLKRSPVEITLIDKRNFHLFQPLLYQVATGGLSPANIAAPLRSLVRRQANCSVMLGEVTEIDIACREVVAGTDRIPYDTLVVAAGVRHSYFGHDEWEQHAPGLKSIEDATAIRARILSAFEAAERSNSDHDRRSLLTFVVIGGGPTGVELAGTLIEIARHTLRRDFRKINPRDARVLLVEAGERVLPQLDRDLSENARKSLEGLGVDVLLKTRVVDVGERESTRGRCCGRPACRGQRSDMFSRPRRASKWTGPAASSSRRTSVSRVIPRSS